MRLSVVAPCFNEEEVIEEFYFRLLNAINVTGIGDYEIILVDDGSSDRTWEFIEKIHRMDPKIKGIQLSRNFGHQAALSAGLNEARGELIFIIDSDLQDPPELLNGMIAKMKEGFDVVYGQRQKRLGETRFKLFTASAFYRVLSSIAEVNIPKDTGDFRLINRKVLEAYKKISESQRFTRGLISWLGFKQAPFLYERRSRFAGTTKYPFLKMMNFSIDAITAFSLKPLRFIAIIGMFSTAISMLAFAYSIYGRFYLKTLPGSVSLFTGMCLLSGIQLLCLGVLGEYIGRIFTESKKRPLYIVQEKLEGKYIKSVEYDLLRQKLATQTISQTSLQ